MNQRATVLALVLVVLPFVFVVPAPVAADNLTWTTEIPDISESADDLSLVAEGIGAGLGMAFELQSANTVGFAYRDAATGWVVRTNDISGTGLILATPKLNYADSAFWISVWDDTIAAPGELYKLYRSPDKGITWSLIRSDNAPTDSTAARRSHDLSTAMANLGEGSVAYEFKEGNDVKYYVSTDDGATWTGGHILTDNSGSPTGIPSLDTGGGEFALPSYPHKGGLTWVTTATGKYYMYEVSGGDNFWTVPFDKSATPQCDEYYDLGTITCPAFYMNTGGTPALKSMHVAGLGSQIRAMQGQGTTDAGVIAYKMSGSPLPPGGATTYDRVGDCSGTANAGVVETAIAGGLDDQMVAALSCTVAPIGMKIWYKPAGSQVWVESFGNTNQATELAAAFTNEAAYVAVTNENYGGQVTVLRAAAPVSTEPPAPDYTSVEVDNLCGFDVDYGANVIVTRQDCDNPTSSTITTYSAQNLVPYATVTSGCGGVSVTSNLVAAMSRYTSFGAGYVTYGDCTDDPDRVNELRIRSERLGAPIYPVDCGSECTGDPTLNVIIPDNLERLARLSENRWNFETDNPANEAWETGIVVLSWVYSTSDGRVGVYTVDVTDGCGGLACADDDDEQSIAFDPTANPQINDICSWTTGKDMVAAASPNSPFTQYEVHGGRATVGGGVTEVSINPFFSSTAYGGGLGVACGGQTVLAYSYNGGKNRVGMLQADGIGAHGELPGTQLWGRIITGPMENRGATMSGDGNYAAYIDGSRIRFVNATTGSGTANLPKPAGLFHSMKMDWAGQALWVATQSRIYRYDIINMTTIVPVSNTNPWTDVGGGVDGPDCGGLFQPGCNTSGQPDSDGDGISDGADTTPGGAGSANAFGTGGQGLFAMAACGLGDALSVGCAVGGLVMATALTAFAGIIASRKDNRLGYIVGATTFALCFIIGWVPVEVVVLLALGLAAKLVMKHKGMFT